MAGAASNPTVQLARFLPNGVELFEARTAELEFIAISHVWGKIEWRYVPLLGREILASKQKAAFINKGLAQLVGSTPFWMDTITVDQKDSDAVIATVQCIPAIFRDAKKTIALREREGFIDCCAEAMKGFDDFADLRRRATEHAQTHFAREYRETYLERLWTFQECFLSHTISFVLYGPYSPKRTRKAADYQSSYTSSRALVDSLYAVAHAYSTDKEKMTEFIRAYLSCGTVTKPQSAVRTKNETIFSETFKEIHQNSPRTATMPRDYIFATMPQFPWYHYPKDAKNLEFGEIFIDLAKQTEMAEHNFTSRITRSMTEPPDQLDPETAWHPSLSQPDPESLGDFLKLIGSRFEKVNHHAADVIVRTLTNESVGSVLLLVAGAMQHSHRLWHESYLGGELSKYGADPSLPLRQTGTAELFEEILSQKDIFREEDISAAQRTSGDGLDVEHAPSNDAAASHPLKVEHQTKESSQTSQDDEHDWLTDSESSEEDDKSFLDAKRQLQRKERWELEFERDSRESTDWVLTQARKILTLLWTGFRLGTPKWDARRVITEMERDATPLLLQALLLITTMVGCQMPLSAAEWVYERFVPVKVMFADFDVLGLVSIHAQGASISKGQKMQCFGRHLRGGDGDDMVLVDPSTMMPTGLLPDMFYDHDALLQRGKYVYPNGVATIGNGAMVILPYMLGLEEITNDMI